MTEVGYIRKTYATDDRALTDIVDQFRRELFMLTKDIPPAQFERTSITITRHFKG